jgi:HD-GYP domain-containing protein (c-di-GMP phosphodiesterase class II)
VLNVSHFAREFAIRAGLNSRRIENIRLGGLLHDIGKLFVSSAILLKERPLIAREWVSLQRHPEMGWRVVSRIPWAKPLAPAVLSHHERWDGMGYPGGLRGAEIPLDGRILAVADTFDAMTTDRPYRSALTFAAARDEIAALSSRQFDPAVVDTLLSISEEDCLALRHGVSVRALRDAVASGPLRFIPASPSQAPPYAIAS